MLWEQCDHCGKCADVCPAKALEMVGEWLTVEQVIDIVTRDLGYYRNSGGGVTFSGGESTMRPRFLIACLKKCKEMGMHTAVDTCGLVKWSVFGQLLPYVDLFLYDIKHMDNEAHRQLTGAGNGLILENLRKISRHGASIWVRVPLMPGYNDSEDHVRRIPEFVRPLKAVEKVSLLPYNSAAGAKYQFIGKCYTLDHVVPPSEEKLMALADIFSRLGVNVELGR